MRSLLGTLLILAAVAASPDSRRDGSTIIFEHEPWYRSRPEPESAWKGTLERREVVLGPAARTALRYALLAERGALPVYAPQPDGRLEPFVGSPVVIRGKLVDLASEGLGTELWPGAISRASP